MVVLDQIIPADPGKGKPSAAELDVDELLRTLDAQILSSITVQLDLLDDAAHAQSDKSFVELDRATQNEVMDALRRNDPGFLQRLAIHTATMYYQDARVMATIGLPPRPPYPEGYTVPRGDLSLLDPVKERGSIWRRTSD